MRKYELTDERIEYKGRTLYRIKALRYFGDGNFGYIREGELGGFVEKEENLNHEGTCWIADEAKAFENAEVYHNAKLYGYAEAKGNCKILGYAEIFDYAHIHDNVKVEGHAKIYGKVDICEDVEVGGDAEIYGSLTIKGDEKIFEGERGI